MNCQETRGVFEDALDRRLSGGVKRKFDLHLSRCRSCRELYAAEQAEHARWFRAMNDEALPSHALPRDFADRLVASVTARGNVRRPSFFGLFRLPRWVGMAAVLALMFAAFATIAWRIENGELRMENGEDSRIENGELRMENDGGVSQTNSQFSILNSQFPSSPPPAVSSGEAKISPGEAKMFIKKFVANVKRAAAPLLVAASLGATAEEPYQFIISGYPAADNCHSDVSSGISLEFGVLSDISVSDALEARSRTDDLSNHSPLRSDKFRGMSISIR